MLSISKGYFRLFSRLFSIIIFLSLYNSYSFFKNLKEKQRIEYEIIKSSAESIFENNFSQVEYFMNFMGQKISEKVVGPIDSKNTKIISQIIIDTQKNLDEQKIELLSWTLFDFVTPNGDVVVTSKKGILEKSAFVKKGKRDWMIKSKESPWQGIFSSKDIGIISKELIIPYGYGITDKNNNFLGTISTGFSIKKLQQKLDNLITKVGINFILLDNHFNIVANSNQKITALNQDQIEQIKTNTNSSDIEIGEIKYGLIKPVKNYPLILMVGKDKRILDIEFKNYFYGLIRQNIILIILFTAILIFFHKAVIYPIKKLSKFAGKISRGENVETPKFNSIEMNHLAKEIEKVRNYTYLEIQKAKAEEAQLAKSSLLKTLSHDLKNYVYGMNGMLEIILESKVKNDLSKEEEINYLSAISKSSKEMSYFLEDLLDAQQAENGILKLNKIEDCDLKEIIERVTLFNQSQSINSRITIKTSFDKNLPKIKFDQKRLKQILMNLIGNAIKYSNANSTVEISCHYLKDNNEVAIYIKDQGIGMTAEEIKMALTGNGAKIEKTGLNKNFNSNGIGLLTVKQLMEAGQGRINITSKKNEGSVIELFFRVI